MPYIKPDDRYALLASVRSPANRGELNFALTIAALNRLGPAPRYADYNDVIEDLSVLADTCMVYPRVDLPHNLRPDSPFGCTIKNIVIKYLQEHDERGVRGAIECCKLELYRRAVVPYENGKRLENGDVYPEAVV